MYIYIYIYISMSKSISIYTYIHIYIYIHTYIQACHDPFISYDMYHIIHIPHACVYFKALTPL